MLFLVLDTLYQICSYVVSIIYCKIVGFVKTNGISSKPPVASYHFHCLKCGLPIHHTSHTIPLQHYQAFILGIINWAPTHMASMIRIYVYSSGYISGVGLALWPTQSQCALVLVQYKHLKRFPFGGVPSHPALVGTFSTSPLIVATFGSGSFRRHALPPQYI